LMDELKKLDYYYKVSHKKSTPPVTLHKCRGLSSTRAQAEGLKLTLKGDFDPTLKGGSWHRPVGQGFIFGFIGLFRFVGLFGVT
jgi:hypothetical protein